MLNHYFRYTIEQREIPEPHWSPIATDIIETSYKVRGLRSKIDYEFRVKATYDGISTEPSYPVSLFRRAGTLKFYARKCYYQLHKSDARLKVKKLAMLHKSLTVVLFKDQVIFSAN